ncbi:MAG: hypothetical protein AAF733_11355, partial [Verrucomicrobiota bacterium]
MKHLHIAMFALLVPPFALGGPMLELIDQKGRTIEAEILELEGDSLKIRRGDGAVFEIAVSQLSQISQKEVTAAFGEKPSP